MLKRFVIIVLIVFNFSFVSPVLAQADTQFTLSISPPLIKNNVSPGQVWASTIKLINNNSKEIVVYAQIVDFKGGKENGTVDFLRNLDEIQESNPHLLSNWMSIPTDPIKIPPLQSVEVPFSVRVPQDAEPGGHYAAILAGNKPPTEKVKGSAIKISSLLASLLLLNVKGEVKENLDVREFSTDKNIYSEPKVDFTVRLENSGNVHVQPQGEIKVYDFWGKEKGSIGLNKNTDFGNILPGSTRKWNFSWEDEKNLLNMGKYKAILMFTYGNEAKETGSQIVYFWIIYFKPLLIILGLLLAFILLIVFSIRFYIRRSIRRAQKEMGILSVKNEPIREVVKKTGKNQIVITQDEISGVQSESKASKKSSVETLIKIIIGLLLVVLIVMLVFYYQDYFGSSDVNPSMIEVTSEHSRQADEKEAASENKGGGGVLPVNEDVSAETKK